MNGVSRLVNGVKNTVKCFMVAFCHYTSTLLKTFLSCQPDYPSSKDYRSKIGENGGCWFSAAKSEIDE